MTGTGLFFFSILEKNPFYHFNLCQDADVLTGVSLSLFLFPFGCQGVVSVSFEEDEEGNHCLIAYPLQSDPSADLENMDPLAECKPKGEVLKWGAGISSSLLVDAENYSLDARGRHSGKEKDKSNG